jgi:hypothetical protein
MFHVTNDNNETVRFDLPSPLANQANYREAAIEAHRLIGGKYFRVALDGEPDGFAIRHFRKEGKGARVIQHIQFVPKNLR